MKKRIGFVGVGSMGQCAHLKNYITLQECEVVALAELRPQLAEQVAARYGVPHVYNDHKTMLDAESLDGIIASQPYKRHGMLLPELFQAGIPVFSEKPISCSVGVGEQILKAADEHNVKHYLGYHKRSDPATKYAKREIETLKETGELGSMRYVRITMPPGDWIASGFADLIRTEEDYPSLPTDPPPEDMDDPTKQKFDVFVNYYIHQINLMRHLMGEDYAVEYADPSQTILITRSESGVVGALEMAPYRTTLDWQEEALITFEYGFIKLELPPPLAINRPGRVTIFKDPESGNSPQVTTPHLPAIHAMRQQATHFIEALSGKATPLCAGPEALKDLQTARDYFSCLGTS